MMQTLTVLYADDHIPVNENHDLYAMDQNEIRTRLKQKNPEWPDRNLDEWTSVYYNASRVIQTLEAAYNVTLANHFQDALTLASQNHFDIAIIDIGWKNDKKLSGEIRPENAGWGICDKIKETDQRLNRKPTLQIAYSSRFALKPELSGDAIGRGVLPFFKTRINAEAEEIEANVAALKAVVRFLALQLANHSPEEEFTYKAVEGFHAMTINSFQLSQDQLKHWSNWTLGALLGSFLLVLIGIGGALFWNVQIGVLTSISSALISIFSSLFFKRLDKAQQAVDNGQKMLKEQYQESIEKLYTLSTKNSQPTTRSQS